MASVIVDGKNKNGDRCSVSVDPFLWSLFVAQSGSAAAARSEVRSLMFLTTDKKLTRRARRYMLRSIAKPSLIRRAAGGESQIDIEDLT